jgi:hypothetical protein
MALGLALALWPVLQRFWPKRAAAAA